MVRRGWRDFLYLNNATAEAKAKVFLNLGKAVAAGTIENVGASSARTEAVGTRLSRTCKIIAV